MNKRWPAMMLFACTLQTAALLRAEPPMGNKMGESYKVADRPDLTDDQKTKLQTARENEMKNVKPLWRKERDLMTKLHDQVEDKASDGDIKATLGQLKAMKKEMQDQMEKAERDREAILTPTQQAKMLLRHHHHGGIWDKPGHDGHDDHEGRDEGGAPGNEGGDPGEKIPMDHHGK